MYFFLINCHNNKPFFKVLFLGSKPWVLHQMHYVFIFLFPAVSAIIPLLSSFYLLNTQAKLSIYVNVQVQVQVELYCQSATCGDIQWNEMSCLTGLRCYINTDIQQ